MEVGRRSHENPGKRAARAAHLTITKFHDYNYYLFAYVAESSFKGGLDR
jgi:hypothetical protein